MPDAIKSQFDALAVHKLTIGWLFLFTLNAIGTSIMSALAGTNWEACTGQTKFLIVIAILVNWSGTMAAFANQSISRLKKGEDLVPTGYTTAPLPGMGK